MEGYQKDSNDVNKRTTNFSQRDIDILVTLVRKHSAFIENKKTDAVTWRQKEEAWNNLTEEFNLHEGVVPRTAKNLKVKFDNIKKTTKKKFANEKQEIFKTGGGSCSSVEITSTDLAIKDILTVGITGLSNLYDSKL
ncbi:Myb/SANT-like DNA-binding domain [Popillia japonica]|uniref:Regulatory protein zeste n=1 Tax=Popillia japonica TaxID=7064 RepID=A0AAW1JHJ8_POPJA